MKTIKNEEFGGERPLYASHGLRLENVTIHAGESALKECSDIEAINCRFEGKYPFWSTDRFKIKDCLFTEGARAAIWYSSNMEMEDCLVEAPKMFREMDHMTVKNVTIPNALETLWMCHNVHLHKVQVDKADYLFMHSNNIDIDDYRQQGNYSFQYCSNVVIRNATIYSKDAFWNTENVTVYDSYITGEYLAWYSKNLRLVNCRIGGTQALCYCEGLIMENCTMDEDADLCFEYSNVHAEIKGHITSIKNPRSGKIVCDSVGEVIIDENIKKPGNCEIVVRE
ncbi:MAG: DUF3737 family protein [Muribaculaceae bacterium]|nr:DUF3737 family protein [Muribaculaceae bacterium]